MIKVLHLRSSFDPGGTEMLLLNLFNQKQDHFQIHFVLLKNGSLIDQLDEKSVNHFYCWFRKRFLDLSVLKKINRLIAYEEIERIHTHQFIELVYALFLKMMNPKVRIFHQIHLIFKKKDLLFYLERFLSLHFARIITVSYAAKAELVKSFGFEEEKLTVLYNGIEANEVTSPDIEQINANVKVEVDPARTNIVMVANFVWGKDHETIFKAYDTFIRDLMPEVSFYFIGRKTDISQRLVETYLNREDIENKRMVLCGPIPNAKTLLSAFDLVVMSCFSETFNIALVEANIQGKVILASDIPVFRELSQEGKYFSLFKNGDPKDFFNRLQNILVNLDKIDHTGNISYFQEKFGFPVFLGNLSEIYHAE